MNWWNEESQAALHAMTELERHHPHGGPGAHLDDHQDLDKDDL